MKKLKCYFSQAITLLKQEERKEYLEVYDYIEGCLLKKHNVKVFSSIKEDSTISEPEIYWRDLKELRKAEFVIAEVSVVSWGVGQEITYAIMLSKPILALYNIISKYKLSEMVVGLELRLREYNIEDEGCKQVLTHHLTEFMTEIRQYLYLRKRLCAKVH